jgi:hypothetical protein
MVLTKSTTDNWLLTFCKHSTSSQEGIEVLVWSFQRKEQSIKEKCCPCITKWFRVHFYGGMSILQVHFYGVEWAFFAITPKQ